MFRQFFNSILSLDPEIRKQKLIDFAKVPKNYIEEVSKLYGKQGKEAIKKRKDKIRMFLKHRVKPMIDALCGTNMNEDLKNIKYKKDNQNKNQLTNLNLNRLLSYL